MRNDDERQDEDDRLLYRRFGVTFGNDDEHVEADNKERAADCRDQLRRIE